MMSVDTTPNKPPAIAPERHWNSVATDWHLWGPPLRPCDTDTRAVAAAVATFSLPTSTHAPRSRPRNVLVYGVTPEIAGLDWPPETCLIAADRAQDMIAALWHREGRHRFAVCGDWSALPFADASMHVVVGDGPFNCFAYPQGWEVLSAQTKRLLAPDGLLVTRMFARPDKSETIDQIVDDLTAGVIGNFHIFKFRLAMALVKPADDGVVMDDIWRAWRDLKIDRLDLAAARGWPPNVIATIDHYAGKKTKLTFPTLAEITAVLERDFELLRIVSPEYEMGDRCPTLSFRRR